MNTTDVDSYLRDGCGRCRHYRTPACKVHRWTPALVALRALLRASGLTETLKWGSPCYTLDDKNVVMLAAFVDHCALTFFRGAELPDPDGVLEPPGPNSRHARMLRFRAGDDVGARRALVQRLLQQAIALQQAGARPRRPAEAEPVPAELQRRLDDDAGLRRAFAALTPGRRRSHVLHVAGAKQAATRARRAEACAPVILAGRGWNERDGR